MAENTGNGKIKRKSKGMRKHIRRMKQETREAGIPLREWKKKVKSQPKPKKST